LFIFDKLKTIDCAGATSCAWFQVHFQGVATAIPQTDVVKQTGVGYSSVSFYGILQIYKYQLIMQPHISFFLSRTRKRPAAGRKISEIRYMEPTNTPPLRYPVSRQFSEKKERIAPKRKADTSR